MQLQCFVITYLTTSMDTLFICADLNDHIIILCYFPLVFLVRQICQQPIVFLFRDTFISPLYFKDTIAGYEIFSWQIFPFNTLNISSLGHLVSNVSKSAVNFIGVPLYVMSCFSPAVFKILSLSSMFQLACVLACAFVFILLGILSFLDMKLIFFIRFGKFPANTFHVFFLLHLVLSLHGH